MGSVAFPPAVDAIERRVVIDDDGDLFLVVGGQWEPPMTCDDGTAGCMDQRPKDPGGYDEAGRAVLNGKRYRPGDEEEVLVGKRVEKDETDWPVNLPDDLHATVFRVDSRALTRQSRIFKAMLTGRYGPEGEVSWREAQPKDGAPWIVRLSEDNPDAVEGLLRLVHFSLEGLGIANRCPGYATMRNLYEMVVVAQKYQMVDCLQPWILINAVMIRGLVECAGDFLRRQIPKMTHAAYELQHSGIFELCIVQLAALAVSRIDGRLYIDDAATLPLFHGIAVDPKVEAILLQTRGAMIRRAVKLRKAPKRACVKRRVTSAEDHACQSEMYARVRAMMGSRYHQYGRGLFDNIADEFVGSVSKDLKAAIEALNAAANPHHLDCQLIEEYPSRWVSEIQEGDEAPLLYEMRTLMWKPRYRHDGKYLYY